MSSKTTRRAIVNGSANIVSAEYCALQHLLHNHNPIAYTCGVYGWNFDVYEIDGLTICTGYRNMPGRRANNIGKYEKEAEKILSWENKIPYEEKREQVEQLLHEFVKQA